MSICFVLFLLLVKSCLFLVLKVLLLYNILSDWFCWFKRICSGFILFVGKMFWWLVKIKVVFCIYDVGVIYFSVCLEYVVEEFVYRVVIK